MEMQPENGDLTDIQSVSLDSLPPHDHTEKLSKDIDAYNTILFGSQYCSSNNRIGDS